MSKCKGCGITLQNIDKNKLGYTPKIENIYCERCFKTINYNKEVKIDDLDNAKIINKINKYSAYVFFITDLFSLNNKVIETFKQIKNKKILIINKMDLIPSNLKLEHLKENIQRVYEIDADIYFISVKKRINLSLIHNLILENKTILLAGETSSGKSSLINEILGINLTTSKYSNTTLDFIKLNYMETTIYDSPGLSLNKEKKNIDNINVVVKNLNKDFVYTINDLKIKGEGSLTMYLPNKETVLSKKEETSLDKEYVLDKNDLILPEGGFIYISKAKIKCNKDLEIRNSIIK